MPRCGAFLGVWPTRFCKARCRAEGFGEPRNWKSSVRSDMGIVVSDQVVHA